MDLVSKRFDTVEVGDEFKILGLRHTVVAVDGDPVGFPDLWAIKAVIELDITAESRVVLPRERFVEVYGPEGQPRKIDPTPKSVHITRAHQFGRQESDGYTVVS